MICPECRNGTHEKCDDVLREKDYPSCFCQHKPRS